MSNRKVSKRKPSSINIDQGRSTSVASSNVPDQISPEVPNQACKYRGPPLIRIASAIETLADAMEARRMYDVDHLNRMASALEELNQRQQEVESARRVYRVAKRQAFAWVSYRNHFWQVDSRHRFQRAGSCRHPLDADFVQRVLDVALVLVQWRGGR
ncbi:unnamed protein product [Sympodiomycopsis kandeliae]